MGLTDFLLRGVVALLLGSLIGAERQWRHRLAGLKTNALVSAGAMLFVSASYFFENEVGTSRIAAQVVSGIGFLGAGVMFRDGITVKGLNTAATLWCAASVGVLSGAGALLEAAVATVIIVIANVVLRDIATRMDLSMGFSETGTTHYRLNITIADPNKVAHVREFLARQVEKHQYRMLSLTQSGLHEVVLDVELASDHPNFQVIERLALSLQKQQTIVNWQSLPRT